MLQRHRHDYEVNIGELYNEDYYVNEPTNIMKNTPFGNDFLSNLPPNGDKFLPTLDELEYLTSRLMKYLASQELAITPISHCHIKIEWR